MKRSRKCSRCSDERYELVRKLHVQTPLAMIEFRGFSSATYILQQILLDIFGKTQHNKLHGHLVQFLSLVYSLVC